MTVGREEFNEMGLFVVDGPSGAVNGVMPSSPNYATQVFASPPTPSSLFETRSLPNHSRNHLPRRKDARRLCAPGIVKCGRSESTPPSSTIGIECRSDRLGEHVSQTSWASVGDRGYDDVFVDVQFGTPYDGNAAPVITAIPNQSIDEETQLVIQTIAMDADLPDDALTYSLDVAPAARSSTPKRAVSPGLPMKRQALEFRGIDSRNRPRGVLSTPNLSRLPYRSESPAPNHRLWPL